jgi:YidC/Oxa1 family membrane protein insertase
MVVPETAGSQGLILRRRESGPEALSFAVKTDHLVLGGDKLREELPLVGQDSYGIRVTETLGFNARDFTLDIRLKVENRHSVPQDLEVVLPWVTLTKWPEGKSEEFQGQRPTQVVRRGPNGIERVEISHASAVAMEGEWIGLESLWYIAALIPKTPGFTLATNKDSNGQVEVAIKAALSTLAPGQSWEGRAVLYLGPKEYDRLKALGVGLEAAIDWGGFPIKRSWGGLPLEWLAVPILWLMNFVYRYIPNYGVAIIIVTVVTKILFYPLTLKSMASMKAMQAIQPQVNAIRSKYKGDPQRVQRETLELYRNYKVNPMGGCLPMVIQIPIFYALYLVFSLSVELQNAEFLCVGRAPRWIPFLGGQDLWICNLATYDPTYVLPVLMGASMFIQQKMTPTMGDPRQAKVMLLMPVVFTFMFLNLPAGLVLYWFVSNVLQIAQQYYTNRVSGVPVRRVAGDQR